jgi:exonuclease SbcC
VEQALDAAVVQAQAGLEAARNAREQSRRELTALDGRMAVQAQALARQEAAASEARTELEASLREHAVGLDELRRALVHDQAWVDAERAALDQLEADRRSARGLVEERERRLAEHVGTPSPEWPAEALAEALEVAAADLEAFQGQWGTLHGQREQDDARRQASVSLQAELERQRARWSTWESLRGLIGSADGAKFRNFAQGLTLDLLVAHANVHLEDLARRYELQRVPGGEMELQVIDREMGDEVRGIHSLSGGEGFLVSLALALGLASLASDRVQVDSLFIDEGFGALDADSLDMAIASLDALYGLGRQVGVISHVGTLVERIGVRVQIDKQGGGRSRLSVLTA